MDPRRRRRRSARLPLTPPPAPPAPGAGASGREVRRWPVRLYDTAEAEAVETWLRDARRTLGFAVPVARLLRELLRELLSDPALAQRMLARLRHQEHDPAGRADEDT